MSNFEQLVDHAAALQREVDRMWTELLILWTAIAAVAIVVAVQAWKAR